MKKIGKKPTDDQMLEGGGGGGGYKSLKVKRQREPDDVALDFLAGGAGLASAAGTAAKLLSPKMTPEDVEYMANYEKNKREAAAEIKRESRGMAKGGMTASARADGCAQRGKTKGRMI